MGILLLLAVAAVALAVPNSPQTALWTLVVAAVLLMGVSWGRTFESHLGRHADRAWTIWLLLPSLGTMGATVIAREAWPIWTVVALVCVTLPTIAVHAMFMGQRDKPTHLGGSGTAPTGVMRGIVSWLPIASALGALLVLVAAGIAGLAT